MITTNSDVTKIPETQAVRDRNAALRMQSQAAMNGYPYRNDLHESESLYFDAMQNEDDDGNMMKQHVQRNDTSDIDVRARNAALRAQSRDAMTGYPYLNDLQESESLYLDAMQNAYDDENLKQHVQRNDASDSDLHDSESLYFEDAMQNEYDDWNIQQHVQRKDVSDSEVSDLTVQQACVWHETLEKACNVPFLHDTDAQQRKDISDLQMQHIQRKDVSDSEDQWSDKVSAMIMTMEKTWRDYEDQWREVSAMIKTMRETCTGRDAASTCIEEYAATNPFCHQTPKCALPSNGCDTTYVSDATTSTTSSAPESFTSYVPSRDSYDLILAAHKVHVQVNIDIPTFCSDANTSTALQPPYPAAYDSSYVMDRHHRQDDDKNRHNGHDVDSADDLRQSQCVEFDEFIQQLREHDYYDHNNCNAYGDKNDNCGNENDDYGGNDYFDDDDEDDYYYDTSSEGGGYYTSSNPDDDNYDSDGSYPSDHG